jgi:hypothetical protein
MANLHRGDIYTDDWILYITIIKYKTVPIRGVEVYKKPYRMLCNYQEIHITGEKDKDDIKLDFARVRIHKIVQERDTLNGVHFSFGDGAKFGLLIRTLDILRQERAQRYIIDSGEIWFFEAEDFVWPMNNRK